MASRDYKSRAGRFQEGVQRDILPLVEGSTVMTKYGPVKTDHILFIAAGPFTPQSPPTDTRAPGPLSDKGGT